MSVYVPCAQLQGPPELVANRGLLLPIWLVAAWNAAYRKDRSRALESKGVTTMASDIHYYRKGSRCE